jgi:hypothetical protein
MRMCQEPGVIIVPDDADAPPPSCRGCGECLRPRGYARARSIRGRSGRRLRPRPRGQAAVDLAAEFAVDGVLTPACLTAGAESGVDPLALRRVWLCLVRFGRIGSSPGRSARRP